MTATELPPVAAGTPAPRHGRLDRSAWSWALFEGVRNPYVILVAIYVFMPYFATVVVGDPVRGQAAVAEYGKIAGWIVALSAPVLGAAIDRYGPRKPWLGAAAFGMVPLLIALWWTEPDGSGLSIAQVVAIAATLNVLFAYAEMTHNAMLQQAAASAPARASGLALALGNGVSVLMLVAVLYGLVLPAQVDWPFVPAEPWFGLDPAQHEPERVVPLLVAALLAAGAIPLLLFARDFPRTGQSLGQATRHGFSDLVQLLKGLRGHRNAARFLIARMLYADGKAALLLFGGVFAAGMMRWGAFEMLAYGILLSVFAVGGGFLGGWLDERIGPKRAIQLEIVGVMLAVVGFLGMSRETILYMPFDPATRPPLWGGPIFTTLPEIVFLAIACSIAVSITAAYASSRTMLAYLAPPAQSGAFFGLYALSGNATAWLAPMLVELFTRAFGSQQAGFVPILGLLAVGWLILLGVQAPLASDRASDP